MSIGGPANPLIAEILNNPGAFTKRPGGIRSFPFENQHRDCFDDSDLKNKKKSKADGDADVVKK